MTLDEAIIARKSIRNFDMDELEPEIIEDLVDFLSELTVPDDSIDWNFDILPLDDMCRVVNGVPRLQAPHYLVIRSEKIKNCLQNAGYIGEMAVLWLTAHNIAKAAGRDHWKQNTTLRMFCRILHVLRLDGRLSRSEARRTRLPRRKN